MEVSSIPAGVNELSLMTSSSMNRMDETALGRLGVKKGIRSLIQRASHPIMKSIG